MRGSVGQSDLGRFVVGEPGLGIGRLVDLNGTTARIRYFRAPSLDPYVDVDHQRSAVRPVSLLHHTRVYVRDDRRWRIGRVDGAHPQRSDAYLVAFPNREGSVLSDREFEVRWARAIEDPYDVLASSGVDSPKMYEIRMQLLSGWFRQKAASGGVAGLLLGSVELHEHQLHVVRSVSLDATRRYLLADEVGLGKTIEAGALIWQHLVQEPDASVLILAPDQLRHQWQDELRDRFRVDGFHDACLHIGAHENPSSWADPPVDVLVVDEAHHLTRAGAHSSSTRARLVDLARSAEVVLLLSATPVRSNESAFLDLLHLLDPENYRLEDLVGFTKRVTMRDQLALTYQALTPSLSSFDIGLYADELLSIFLDDELLAALLQDAQRCDDTDRPAAIARLRLHLSETYRLHHRLLRTRRTGGVASHFRVRGRRRGRPFTVHIDDETARTRGQLLDGVRTHLVAVVQAGELARVDAVEAFRAFAECCGSLPHALVSHVREMLANATTSSPARGAIREWLESVGTNWTVELEAYGPVVLDRVATEIIRQTLARDRGAVVVVTQFTEIARLLKTTLVEERGAHRVASHLATDPIAVNAAEADRWRDDDDCRVLVCDATAEEGINLQAADVIVHLDLPWRGFRLEQRVGRADRHVEATVDPVESMVLSYGEEPFSENWFAVAADAVGVFDHSISALQHVLSDLEDEIHWETMMSGPDALDHALDTMRPRIEAEIQRIAAHDSLDAVQSGEASRANGQLIALDRDSSLPSALVSWFRGVGTSVQKPRKGTIRFCRKPRPQVPFALETAISPWLDKELAFKRNAAQRLRLPILRAGHGLVDAVAEHVLRDDRGIAFSLFRPVARQWPAAVFFRTDFLVSIEVSDELMAFAQLDESPRGLSASLAAWAPPLVETTYTDLSGRQVDHPALRRSYSRNAGDRNLAYHPDAFRAMTAHLNWQALCSEGLDKALSVLRTRDSMTRRPEQIADLLRSDIAMRLSRARVRRDAGLPDAEGNSEILGSMLEQWPQRLSTKVDVLGCGVLLLADPDRAGLS